MKPVLIIFILFTYVSSFGQKTISCTCQGFIDTSYKGNLVLKDFPKGKVTQSIPYRHKKGDYLVFDITQTADSFFYVRLKYQHSGIAYQGWIRKGKYLTTYIKSSHSELPLFYEASYTSKIKTRLPVASANYFQIYNCTQNWIYIRDIKQNPGMQGWIHAQNQCAVPSGICR